MLINANIAFDVGCPASLRCVSKEAPLLSRVGHCIPTLYPLRTIVIMIVSIFSWVLYEQKYNNTYSYKETVQPAWRHKATAAPRRHFLVCHRVELCRNAQRRASGVGLPASLYNGDIYIYIYTYIHMHTYIRIYMCIYIYTYIFIYLFIYYVFIYLIDSTYGLGKD